MQRLWIQEITPMFNAVEEGELETVKFLSNIGGDLNSITKNGDTLLHVAARYGHTEVGKFILASVIDKNPLNEKGDTPLQEAARNGSLDICTSICQHLKDKDFVIGRELVYSVCYGLWK